MNTSEHATGRVKQVIAMFEQGMDAKVIAKKLGFADHRQMANYMKSKEYIWDSARLNYAPLAESKPVSDEEDRPRRTFERLSNGPIAKLPADFLKFLEEHQDVLVELVSNYATVSQLPRYVIPGVYTTKSVYMNHGIDLLTREFSEERNISQKDIFEIALIDFFKKYGYQEQIKLLLR